MSNEKVWAYEVYAADRQLLSGESINVWYEDGVPTRRSIADILECLGRGLPGDVRNVDEVTEIHIRLLPEVPLKWRTIVHGA
jgi:hypothetical protein